MRAAYHYYLMELYGPIPIVDHSMTLEDDLDLPRNSLDEVIEFIDRELKECMEEMAQELIARYRERGTSGNAG